MKCPLMFHLFQATPEQRAYTLGDCFEEECAWWNNNSQQCVFMVISGELYCLVEVMEEIRTKLGDTALIQNKRG